MMTDADGQANAGSADGRSAAPLPHNAPAEDDDERHQGDIEIGIGMPISDAEYRRMKEEARRLERGSDAPDNNDDDTDVDSN